MLRSRAARSVMICLVSLSAAGLAGGAVAATPVHASAAVACDPLVMSASATMPAGGKETIKFAIHNCTTTSESVVLTGKRLPATGCAGSGVSFGDSPPFTVAGGATLMVSHAGTVSKCKGTYKVVGDAEIAGTETVLDADATHYKAV